jgi:hypothetical protein
MSAGEELLLSVDTRKGGLVTESGLPAGPPAHSAAYPADETGSTHGMAT